MTKGSPPHTRGKVQGRFCQSRFPWITPAYTGKRLCKTQKQAVIGDHPRIHGEKMSLTGITSGLGGSPPHTRGKGKLSHKHRQKDRITPAYTGKRLPFVSQKDYEDNHPRIHGEKIDVTKTGFTATGSPPHTRGKGYTCTT